MYVHGFPNNWRPYDFWLGRGSTSSKHEHSQVAEGDPSKLKDFNDVTFVPELLEPMATFRQKVLHRYGVATGKGSSEPSWNVFIIVRDVETTLGPVYDKSRDINRRYARALLELVTGRIA